MCLMMMSVRKAPPLLLIFLLIVQGVYSADGEWGVNYSSSSICALKGSTVIINCTYKYPTEHQIMNVFWTNINVEGEDPPDLFNESEYSQRIQYLGDKQHDCTMRLTDVRQTDSHEYYFRFITDKNKWIGDPGVTLDITNLQVESSGERVTEGHSVTLTCKSRCSLTDRSTFIWFKNTQTLSDRNNEIILQSVTREDAGNYKCAVQGHKLTSPNQYLNIMYAPKQTHVVVNPCSEIKEGDAVTLTCSSDANPPVYNYTWFKENETSSVKSGQTYSITNINSSHSGLFYCEAQNEVGSQRSAAVSVNVKVVTSVSLSVAVGVGFCVGVCGASATLIVGIYICRRKSLRRKTSKHKPENDDASNNTYTVLELRSRSSDLYDTLTPNRQMLNKEAEHKETNPYIYDD